MADCDAPYGKQFCLDNESTTTHQKKLFALLCVPASVVTVFLVFSQVFVSATPDHWCRVPELEDLTYNGNNSLTDQEKKSISIPFRNGRYEKCLMFDIDYRKRLSSFNYSQVINTNDSLPTVPCRYGWIYDKTNYDNTLVTELNLVCDNSWKPSLATTLFYLGSLIGSIVFGFISDRYGRRPALLLVLVPDILISVMTCFSPNYVVYTLLRTLSGLFFPALYQISFVLALELVGHAQRTTIGVIIAMCFALGMSLLAILSYFLRDAFKLSLATSVPLLAMLSYYWLIPESPRWLLSRNRGEEARLIIAKMTETKGTWLPQCYPSKPLKRVVFSSPSAKPEISKSIKVRPKEGTVTLFDALGYSQTRIKFVILSFNWIANSIVYNGLSYNVSNLGISDQLAFFIGGIIEIPGHLATLYTMNIYGRRNVLFFMMFTGGLACISCMLVAEDSVWLTLVLAMIGKFGNAAAFSVFYVFIGELLPTVIRSQAMGVASFVAGIGLLGFPQIIRLADYNRSLPLFVMGLISVTGSLMTLFLPETLNSQLPQIIEDSESQRLRCGLFRNALCSFAVEDVDASYRIEDEQERENETGNEETICLSTTPSKSNTD